MGGVGGGDEQQVNVGVTLVLSTTSWAGSPVG